MSTGDIRFTNGGEPPRQIVPISSAGDSESKYIDLVCNGKTARFPCKPKTVDLVKRVLVKDFDLGDSAKRINDTIGAPYVTNKTNFVFQDIGHLVTEEEMQFYFWTLRNYDDVISRVDQDKIEDFKLNLYRTGLYMYGAQPAKLLSQPENDDFRIFNLLYLTAIRAQSADEDKAQVFDNLIGLNLDNVRKLVEESYMKVDAANRFGELASSWNDQNVDANFLKGVWSLHSSFDEVADGASEVHLATCEFQSRIILGEGNCSAEPPDPANVNLDTQTQLAKCMDACRPVSQARLDAWKKPIKTIADNIASSNMAILYPRDVNKVVLRRAGGEYPNTFGFNIAFMDEMSSRGFNDWAIFDSPNGRYTIGPIVDLVNEGRSSTTVPEMMKTVQEYFNIDKGGTTQSLEEYLALPGKYKTTDVRHTLDYLQEVWNAKNRSNSRGTFFLENATPGVEEFATWFSKRGAGDKKIFLGRAEALAPYKKIIIDEDIPTILHRSADGYNQRLEFSFDYGDGITQAVFDLANEELGDDLGVRNWGDRLSVAIPIVGEDGISQSFLSFEDSFAFKVKTSITFGFPQAKFLVVTNEARVHPF